MCEYPDRRIKGIVYTMASFGIRLGAWDYLGWANVQPILQEGNVIAAKIIVFIPNTSSILQFGKMDKLSN